MSEAAEQVDYYSYVRRSLRNAKPPEKPVLKVVERPPSPPVDIWERAFQKWCENEDRVFGPLVCQHREDDDLAFGPVVCQHRIHAITVEDVLRETRRHFKMTRTEILAELRTPAVVYPRHIAMYLSRQLTGRSLPFIGRHYGGRDHTTVLSAVRKIAQLVADGDKQTVQSVEAITAELTG